MTERTHEKELDALKADIARLREEIVALVAATHAEGEHEASKQGGPANGGHGHGGGTDVRQKLDEAWARGEKVVKDLAAEIERHPLAGSMAAFGLGFIIAKLWYRGSKE